MPWRVADPPLYGVKRMTTDYLHARRTHLLTCLSALAKSGARVDTVNDRFALVTWGAWTPGKRPSTKLVKLEAPRGTHPKDQRVWGRVLVGSTWAKRVRTFEPDTVLATFWMCPSVPTLKALKRALPRIPEEHHA